MADAISYTLRESDRARNVRLRVSGRDGLVVVVPRGFSADRVPALLEMRRPWIERALARFEAQRAHREAQLAAGRPRSLHLRAIGETWRVEYRDGEATRSTTRERDDGLLIVTVPAGDDEAARTALRRWLARRARATLAPELLGMADTYGYDVPRVSVRWQRSRWGSRSATGTISLNAQVLFLPRDLAHYVLAHELCHCVHMDHSAGFWHTVSLAVPGYAECRHGLRDGWSFVPAWLLITD